MGTSRAIEPSTELANITELSSDESIQVSEKDNADTRRPQENQSATPQARSRGKERVDFSAFDIRQERPSHSSTTIPTPRAPTHTTPSPSVLEDNASERSYHEKCRKNRFDFSQFEDMPDKSCLRYDPSRKDCLTVFEDIVCTYYMTKDKKRSYDGLCEKLSKSGLGTYDVNHHPSLWEFLNDVYFPKAKALNLPPFAIA